MNKKDRDLSAMIVQIFDLPIPFTVCSKKPSISPLLLTHSFSSIYFTIEKIFYIVPLIGAKCDIFFSLGKARQGITLKIGVIGVRTVKILSHGEINYLWSYRIILTIAWLANSFLFCLAPGIGKLLAGLFLYLMYLKHNIYKALLR